MKKIFLLALTFCLAYTSFSQELINRNRGDQFIKKVTTTGATATKIDSIVIAADEVGFITIKMIGYSEDSVAAVTGIRTYRYTKVGGTLTLGSAIETQAIVADAKVSGGTFAASASANNILIKVTGEASVVMRWYAITKQLAVKND